MCWPSGCLSLESALLAAKMAGHGHVSVDGTLIETDRCPTPGPTKGVDLWWSGKHHNHGENVQVITAPDGWPLWTSQVRPGREHDTTALPTHTEILPALTAWTGEDLSVLGDLGYEGEAGTITVAFKKPQGGQLTAEQKTHNKTHNGKRAIGERGNSLLKTTFRALRNISLCPGTSARSSPPHSSCCTQTMTAPDDHAVQRDVTRKGSVELEFVVAGRDRPELLAAVEPCSTWLRRLYRSASNDGGRPPADPLRSRFAT